MTSENFEKKIFWQISLEHQVQPDDILLLHLPVEK